MESVLKSALRKFNSERHIVQLLSEDGWVEMFDNHGNVLAGIRGKPGAAEVSASGEEIGVDVVEMDPGSAFPLHVHPGDHILYVEAGACLVHVDGTDHRVSHGESIFIAAEYPHGVKALPGVSVRFLAFGHPHKHVGGTDRMTLVDDGRAGPA